MRITKHGGRQMREAEPANASTDVSDGGCQRMTNG
jgi:hypothetical protein